MKREEVNEALAELERIRGLLAETLKASEMAAQERAYELSEQSNLENVTTIEAKNKAYMENGKSFSLRNSKSGRANDLLLPYDDELTRFIKQRGDYIVNNFEELKSLVDLAFDNLQKKATAYFGIVPHEILEKIEKSIPNLPKELKGTLFKTGRDYSVAATFDSIRHLADEKSLSKEEIVDYLDRMADTIVECDTVAFDYYYEKGNRMNGVLFKKEFNDGTIRSFEIVSNKKRTLNLQTVYLENGDYIKKKSAKSTLMEKPSADVQDEERSNFNSRLPQNPDSVKSVFSRGDLDHQKSVEGGDETETNGNANFSLKNKNLTINNRIPFVELKGYIHVAKNDNTSLNTLETKIKNLKRGTYQIS